MGILQKLKRKAAAPKEEAVVPKKPADVSKEAKPAKEKAVTAPVVARATESSSSRDMVYAYRVLQSPLISEKSATLTSLRQYIFKIHPNANKAMVARAVQELYSVKPTAVRIIKVPGKTVMRGRRKGRKSGFKKAIVTVPSGSSLPIYESV